MINIITKKVYDKIGEATLSLIGVSLIHLGLGIISTWGANNLYVFSYFHYLGYHITPSTNSIILMLTVIPMAIAMFISNKLAKKYGEERVIRIGSAVFMLSPLFAIQSENLEVFVFFVLVIPTSMFSIITVPALSCIWSQYQNAKSRVTAIIAISLGAGTLLWNPVTAHIVNPDNEGIVQGSSDQMQFFSESVSNKVLSVSIGCFVISGVLAVIGSFMMKHKEQEVEEQQQQKHEEQKEEENKPQQFQKQLYLKSIELQTQSQRKIIKKEEYHQLSDVFKDPRFILLMIFILVSTLFEIQLVLNLKIIYMPIINDDHFLTYSLTALAAVAIITAYFWGFICDKKGIAFCMVILLVVDTSLKIFSLFIVNKVTLAILIFMVGLESKALGTFVAPGFVEMYGFKLGTQLIPYKGISFLLGFILAPLIQVLTSPFTTKQTYLSILALSCIVTTPIGLAFIYLTKKAEHTANNTLLNNNKDSDENL